MRFEEIEDYGPRRSGRTTRCADQAIQTLFEKGYVYLIDHHDTERMSKYLLDIVERRLDREHRLVRGVHYRVINPHAQISIHFAIEFKKK